MQRPAAQEWLTGLWYLAGLSRDFAAGSHQRRILFGDPVLLGRSVDGALFALRDVCPHRAAPLSRGRQVDHDGARAVECPYHGWRFALEGGTCLSVPALCQDAVDKRDPGGVSRDDHARPRESTVSVPAYRVHEANGLIWIAHGGSDLPPPEIGLPARMTPRTVTTVMAEGPYDEAALGLVDPAHTPVVHKQWWWRDGAPRKDKEKVFEPTALGFRMPPHSPSSNSRIYKFLGGAPTTDIEFRLPALRLEHIAVGRRRVLGLTAMTPIEESRTQIVHVIFHDVPWIAPFRPVIQSMADSFLAQDGAILTAQNENLSRLDHRPLYLGDPDVPAQWYFRMKKAWAEKGDGLFTNPVPAARLRWRT